MLLLVPCIYCVAATSHNQTRFPRRSASHLGTPDERHNTVSRPVHCIGGLCYIADRPKIDRLNSHASPST